MLGASATALTVASLLAIAETTVPDAHHGSVSCPPGCSPAEKPRAVDPAKPGRTAPATGPTTGTGTTASTAPATGTTTRAAVTPPATNGTTPRAAPCVPDPPKTPTEVPATTTPAAAKP